MPVLCGLPTSPMARLALDQCDHNQNESVQRGRLHSGAAAGCRRPRGFHLIQIYKPLLLLVLFGIFLPGETKMRSTCIALGSHDFVKGSLGFIFPKKNAQSRVR